MKKQLIRILLLLALSIASQVLLAQPPDPPGDPSAGGGPIGGSAPIGGGIGILLTLGAAYGARKLYNNWKMNQEELEE
ncbi:MAG: hypothetical protein KGZ82_12695 [Bacteroidales bacterium]|nr:hypothetical protein [Bacteroidales bacterium]